MFRSNLCSSRVPVWYRHPRESSIKLGQFYQHSRYAPGDAGGVPLLVLKQPCALLILAGWSNAPTRYCCARELPRALEATKMVLSRRIQSQAMLTFAMLLLSGTLCLAQRGIPPSRTSGFTLFGDVDVAGNPESDGKSRNALLDLLLYTRSGVLVD